MTAESSVPDAARAARWQDALFASGRFPMNTSGRMTQDTVLFFAMREADAEVAAAVLAVQADNNRRIEAVAERDRARDIAAHLEAAVRELHKPFGGGGDRNGRCTNDGFLWPCSTIRHLEAELAKEGEPNG